MLASEEVKKLTLRPSNQDLLELYSLYKQVYYGDCTTPCPSILDLKAREKWKWWNGKRGMSQYDAMSRYILLVSRLLGKQY